MQIFALKHFSKQKAFWFSMLINLAIVFSATIAAFYRFSRKFALPIIDAICIYTIVFLVQFVWAKFIIYPDGGQFSTVFMRLIIPAYLLLWLGIMHLTGSYDKPYNIKKPIYGLLLGSLLILLIYSLVPESYRFSRAIILISMILNIGCVSIIRIGTHKLRIIELDKYAKKRMLIIGDKKEYKRLQKLFKQLNNTSIIGYIFQKEEQDTEPSYLGKPEDLNDLIKINKADELVFCSTNFSTQEIISFMSFIKKPILKIRIAPSESNTIIGSNSILSFEDVFTYELNTLNHPTNKRLKRVFDFFIALCFIIIFPFAIFRIKNPFGFLINIFKVLFAQKTWVGYFDTADKQNLPQLKTAVLNPTDLFHKMDSNTREITESNLQYAKEYQLYTDLCIITKVFNQLGRQ